MLIAYGELEREMQELRNNIGRKTNPSESEALSAWREQLESSRAEAYENLESTAAKLTDAADRIRERRYGGARLIEVAPIREPTANAIAVTLNAPEGRSTSGVHNECDREPEITDRSHARLKSIKKEMRGVQRLRPKRK